MKKIFTLGTVSTVVASLLVGCGSNSSSNSDSSSNNSTTAQTETGYFIDSPVAGIEYNTSSGINGTTDSYGRFQFKSGDSIKFSIGKLSLGESTPDSDGLITPESLSNGDEEVKTVILRVLQALDIDNNPSNGIVIPSDIIESLNSLNIEVSLNTLQNDSEILSLNSNLAEKLDEDYDGTIDVSAQTAEQHYEQSITMWHNGHRPDREESSNGNRDEEHGQANGNINQEHGQNESSNGHNGEEHDQNRTFDINSYPLSTLTQDLKDAISYMGNEERLAHDVYTNLYNYHSENSGIDIMQLKNIADRSETTHVQTVQSIVRKYNLSEENLTNVTTPVASSATAFEELPSGVYDIPAIQGLYDALYTKGIQSQKDALEVGCMVEVTDINDLNDRIEIAQESNATDIVDAFTILRDASYNHYWAFDKGLQNLGIENGCCSLGEIDGVNYCHPEYPQNEHSDNNNSSENQGQGQGQRRGQGQGHGRD